MSETPGSEPVARPKLLPFDPERRPWVRQTTQFDEVTTTSTMSRRPAPDEVRRRIVDEMIAAIRLAEGPFTDILSIGAIDAIERALTAYGDHCRDAGIAYELGLRSPFADFGTFVASARAYIEADHPRNDEIAIICECTPKLAGLDGKGRKEVREALARILARQQRREARVREQLKESGTAKYEARLREREERAIERARQRGGVKR